MVSTRTLTYTQPLKGFCPVKRGFGEIGGVCGLAGGIELGVAIWLPRLHHWNCELFLRSGELRGRVWRGKRVFFFFFKQEGEFGNLPNSAFLLSKKAPLV